VQGVHLVSWGYGYCVLERQQVIGIGDDRLLLKIGRAHV
jgi:hypothetical protein